MKRREKTRMCLKSSVLIYARTIMCTIMMMILQKTDYNKKKEKFMNERIINKLKGFFCLFFVFFFIKEIYNLQLLEM